METIFHFNCVICGAHLKEKDFNKFTWPSSQQQIVDLISSIKWILPNVEKTTWASVPYRQAIRNLIDKLSGNISPPLNKFKGKETIFTRRCPLCDTPAGPRPYDRYFRAWFAWNLLCKVQVGNLLYELSKLFNRIGETKYLIPYFKNVIDHLELNICYCGRPTTALYGGGYCRWCIDSGANIKDKKHVEDSVSFIYNDSLTELEQQLIEDLQKQLYSIREDDIFGIGKERWGGLLDAMVQDVKEEGTLERLQNAIFAYELDTVLNKVREKLSIERRWPGFWNEAALAEPILVPDGYEKFFVTYLDWPREVIETLLEYRKLHIPEEIAFLLEQQGLLKYGEPSDVRLYLESIRIDQVRDISNKLNAGKARSKSNLIDKILSTASYEQIVEVHPDLKEKWVKEMKWPWADLGEGWRDYANLNGLLLKDFLLTKFDSLKLQRQAQNRGEHIFVQLDSECPSSCKILSEKFTVKDVTSLNDIPPWFPGCGCSLGCQMKTWMYGEKQPVIGSKVLIEEEIYGATLQPYDLIMSQYVKSPNRKYHLFWQDGSSFETEFEPGCYILIEDGVINAVGRLNYPNDGKVANNGTFIISDWMPYEYRAYLKRGGIIWVLNRQGQVILRHRITLFIDSIAISENGKLAVCSSSGIPLIQVFDLESKRLINEFSPEVYYSSIEIDESTKTICLVDDNGKKIMFTLAGEVIDKEAYHNVLNENVSGYQLIDDVANALLNDDKVDYQNLETLLRKALEKGVSTYTQGVAYRLLGEIAEAKGNVAQAIDMYTTALQYAPKLPIRKKLKALKESIGG
jgi:hypothetical protein